MKRGLGYLVVGIGGSAILTGLFKQSGMTNLKATIIALGIGFAAAELFNFLVKR